MSPKNTFDENLDYCLRADRISYPSSKEEARANVMNRISVSSTINEKNTGFSFLKVAAAILVLVMGSSVAYYFSGIKVIENNGASVAAFSLPDGSIVKLNQQAVATYNSSTWFLNREINLAAGEAFFEVEKGNKFTVETILGDISVLGTSFNVSLRNNDLYVACKTGKVKVDLPVGDASLILTPGKAVNTAFSTTETLEANMSTIGNWTRGEFAFENVLVKEVFKTLEAQSDYTIEIPEGLEIKYSGQFDINQPMNNILELVCIPLSLNYSIDSKTKIVSITKK